MAEIFYVPIATSIERLGLVWVCCSFCRKGMEGGRGK